MSQISTLMESIEAIDKCIKSDLTDEAREYCLALKKILVAMECINFEMDRALGKESYIN